MSTYFPAVETANEGEGPAAGAVQLHMVSLQDEVVQLQAVQCLGLGHVQATHEAAGADVNGALAGERAGVLRGQGNPKHAHKTYRTLASVPLPSLCLHSQASPAGGSAAGHSQDPAGRGPPAGS